MGLLLGESTEFVLGHLVGCVVFVPRLPPGGGSPGVQVDCRVASGCLDIHLRVNCVLRHLNCCKYFSSACPSPRGRHFWSLDGWRSCEAASVSVCFSLGHATKYTESVLFTTLFLFPEFALNLFLDLGPCVCHFNFRGIPCISLFYHYVEFYSLVGHNGPNFDLIPKRDIYIFRQINSFAIHV